MDGDAEMSDAVFGGDAEMSDAFFDGGYDHETPPLLPPVPTAAPDGLSPVRAIGRLGRDTDMGASLECDVAPPSDCAPLWTAWCRVRQALAFLEPVKVAGHLHTGWRLEGLFGGLIGVRVNLVIESVSCFDLLMQRRSLADYVGTHVSDADFRCTWSAHALSAKGRVMGTFGSAPGPASDALIAMLAMALKNFVSDAEYDASPSALDPVERATIRPRVASDYTAIPDDPSLRPSTNDGGDNYACSSDEMNIVD